ncbi:MAG: GNAT family N-acetyltransferase [Pseudolabrys sp.]
MNLKLRRGSHNDAEACGRIIYDAFKALADKHKFPPDFPSAEIATGRVSTLLSHPGIYGVVAELDGRIVGSNFLDERSSISGIGPISVDPTVQERGIGRQLMQDVLDRAAEQKFPGVRLLQTGFNNRSLCLYTMLGFRSREPISILQGKAINAKISGYDVRPATEADADACNRLCRQVHGHDRNGELIDAIRLRTASVVVRGDCITGYTSAIAFFGHAVAETNADLMAMIAAAPEFGGPGFLVPTRNYELLSWCLGNRLRLVYQMTLMTIGLYNEPAGVWLPSEIY